VEGNPINVIDPTGFSPIGDIPTSAIQSLTQTLALTNQFEVINALECKNLTILDTKPLAQMLRNVFGITLINWERSASWEINEQWIAIQATEVSKAFWRSYNSHRGSLVSFNDQYQLFRAIMGPIRIQQNYDDYGTTVDGNTVAPGTPCITGTVGGESINCYSLVNNNLGAFSWMGIIIHEMGHVFDNRTGSAGSIGLYKDKELTAVIGGGIDPITGNWQRSENGYQSTPNGANGEAKPYVQHYVKDNNGVSYNEDFADMFMNWVVQNERIYNNQDNKWYRLGFSSDIYGNARYNWIDSRMPNWMQLAMRSH
jgi:hypothetical protein